MKTVGFSNMLVILQLPPSPYSPVDDNFDKVASTLKIVSVITLFLLRADLVRNIPASRSSVIGKLANRRFAHWPRILCFPRLDAQSDIRRRSKLGRFASLAPGYLRVSAAKANQADRPSFLHISES